MDGPYKVDRTYDPAIYCKRSSVTGPGVSIAFTSEPFEMQEHLNAAYAAGRASMMPLVDAWSEMAKRLNENLECYCVSKAEWTCGVCRVRNDYANMAAEHRKESK